MESILEEWNELEKEFTDLDDQHKVYCHKVEDVKSIQRKCLSAIAHQRYVIKRVQDSLNQLGKCATAEDKAKILELETKIEKRRCQFHELEDVLPHENGIYLKIVLGSVNVSLLSKNDKFKYKEDYEHFKLYVTIVNLLTSLVAWRIFNYRVTDAMFQFLLVWYYCTLTIREHILRVNGSRIKGWWITHHFISTACAGILLIWPDGYTYHEFRNQFFIFSLYLTLRGKIRCLSVVALVQMMQYYYQSGTLYRLRALGERRSMDLTVEGFQSWMWKGLSFLLPFLIIGYFFQLYNAYVLLKLAFHPQCSEWQVIVLSGIFLVLFMGNTWTATISVRQKLKEKLKQRFSLYNKYRFSDNER